MCVKTSLEKSKIIPEEKRKTVRQKICKKTHFYNNCFSFESNERHAPPILLFESLKQEHRNIAKLSLQLWKIIKKTGWSKAHVNIKFSSFTENFVNSFNLSLEYIDMNKNHFFRATLIFLKGQTTQFQVFHFLLKIHFKNWRRHISGTQSQPQLHV